MSGMWCCNLFIIDQYDGDLPGKPPGRRKINTKPRVLANFLLSLACLASSRLTLGARQCGSVPTDERRNEWLNEAKLLQASCSEWSLTHGGGRSPPWCQGAKATGLVDWLFRMALRFDMILIQAIPQTLLCFFLLG